jgi:UDP-3-O-[3-hydroxymyristoyl] glucosamine N-acyltransferase
MRPAARSFALGELVELLGGELAGDAAQRLAQVAPLDAAGPQDISYFASEAYRREFEATRAGAVVVHPSNARPGLNCICTGNPQLYFIRVLELFHPDPGAVAGVHAQAWVHPEAEVAASAEVGAFAAVEQGARIGERVRIGPGCRIGRYAEIGEDSNLHANVTVYAHCIVGKRAVLNAGCVIGSDGFGGALERGRWVKMPHVGRVVLGDDVEVGANTTIDRGAMADTVLGDGVKLDNLIQIGHNVQIGANTSIAACAGIAGSARIGANCVIGGSADISGHLHLADGVQISPSTMIGRSIEVPGRYTGIFPWSEHRTWLRIAAVLRRLGDAGGAGGQSEGRARSGTARKRIQKDRDDGHH